MATVSQTSTVSIAGIFYFISIVGYEPYLRLVAATLVTYDVVLTLDEEIALVWGRTWTKSTPLYLLNRYGVPAQTHLALLFSAWIGFRWITLMMLVTIESLLVLGVCAMYGSNRVGAFSLSAFFSALPLLCACWPVWVRPAPTASLT